MEGRLAHLGVVATPRPGMPTERDELAELNGLEDVAQTLPPAAMLELTVSGPRSRPVLAAWPPATLPALEHPGLPGALQRVRAHGHTTVLDTSLRGAPASSERGLAKKLLRHLASVGAYYSEGRRCIGLAADTPYHELVHETTHLRFATRVDTSAAAAGADAPPSASYEEPLAVHWHALRRRGYSAASAEELVCREHELRALRASGGGPWQWVPRAVVVLDAALQEAREDIMASGAAAAERAGPAPRRAAADELRRIEMLRRCVTGPGARLGHLAALLLLPTLAAAAVLRGLGR